MIGFKEVKSNPQVLEFLEQSRISIEAINYNEHGFRHANLVAQRARQLAKQVGLSKRGQELATIAGYCHDFGNFLGRSQHHYWGALLFHQIFSVKDACLTGRQGPASGGQENFTPKELSWIMQAIANHDKDEMKITNPISALVILADKSDVHRSRAAIQDFKRMENDIHNRVCYAVTKSDLKAERKEKQITLTLKIDVKFVPIIEYFEIFTERMTYCRQAANYLGYKFKLVINDFKLL
jgi:hypothetical protein